MKPIDGGKDEYGKYVIFEYENGQQEKVYFTGPKKSSKATDLSKYSKFLNN